MGIIDRLYSFVVIRGWKMWVSYKTQVVLTMINWVIPVFVYFFIGVTLGFGRLSTIRDYTAFMVIGTAFQGYFSASVTTLAGRIRNEELIGTLEYLIAAPLRPMTLMMYSTVWGLVINSISAVTVLLIGLGLGISYKVNALATITFLILYLASIIGLNLIAGAVVLIVKQGNPIALFTSVASNLLGGVVFPISVLPTWLRYISYSLSLTWALSGLRGAMLSGYGIQQLLNYLWPLATLALAYIVIGVALSNYAFARILREGSVHMY